MPPPPPPGPPPPRMFGGSKSGSADNRGALLSSIRQGTKLKKTVTVDKSGPYIAGKTSSTSSGSSMGNGIRSGGPTPNGGAIPGLGGLFAGGMPKLKPTRKLTGTTLNGQIKTDAPRFPPPQQRSPEKTRPDQTRQFYGANIAAISEALTSREGPPTRPMVRSQPSEVKTRGPPPQPPVQKQAIPLSSSDSVLITGSITERISNLQQASEQTKPTNMASTLERNRSSLHSGSSMSLGSMTSLSSTPTTSSPLSSLSTSDLSDRPRISDGKPNLAPKPPTLAPASDRPSPPPKKLIVSGKLATRAQSMRAPRSPPVSPPSPASGRPPPPAHPPVATKNPASHFGTLRAPRGLRPPGVCPPPPPGAPPPPPAPPARAASLAHPPPPPPHHRVYGGGFEEAPAPPVRGSSIRAELEARFAELFNPPAAFPPPGPFLRIDKGYSSATVASKAPAPAPPLRVPLVGWSGTSSAC